MGDDHQGRPGLGAAGEQQVDDRCRRWRRRDCRSARRRRSAAGAGRWRGRWRRAAARRPKAAPGNASRRWPRPTASSSSAARSHAPSTPASSSGVATFSCAVIVGSRWKACSTMPIRPRRARARASSSSAEKSAPATVSEPDVARSSPVSTAISELLPEPEGPSRASVSPAATSRSIPRRISTAAAPSPSVRRRSRAHNCKGACHARAMA